VGFSFLSVAHLCREFYKIKMFKFNFSCADGNEDSRLEEDASVEQQSLNSDNRLRPSVEIDDNNDDVSYRL